jgi:hypothetical protein
MVDASTALVCQSGSVEHHLGETSTSSEPWHLLKQARKRGYLTRDEFDQTFGPELPPDCTEALTRELWGLNQHPGDGR